MEIAFADRSAVAGSDSFCCWLCFCWYPGCCRFPNWNYSVPAFVGVLAVVGMSANSVPFVGVIADITTMFL
jgi:hypothetical protein